MPKKTTKTNPILITLLHELKKHANENKAQIWKDIATRLENSSNNWPVVNLDKINRYIGEKETALIPGKVLSNGELTKKVTISAWSFSEKAQEKIKKSGSKYMSIEELMKQNPKGKDIRIMG